MTQENGLTPQEAENVLLNLWQDEASEGEGDWFKWIGLPAGAEWGAFRLHYHQGSVADATTALNDLSTYPPIAERIAELKAERAANAADALEVLNRRQGEGLGSDR